MFNHIAYVDDECFRHVWLLLLGVCNQIIFFYIRIFQVRKRFSKYFISHLNIDLTLHFCNVSNLPFHLNHESCLKSNIVCLGVYITLLPYCEQYFECIKIDKSKLPQSLYIFVIILFNFRFCQLIIFHLFCAGLVNLLFGICMFVNLKIDALLKHKCLFNDILCGPLPVSSSAIVWYRVWAAIFS